MLPLVLARTHEVKQIAKGGTNFKHWGDGITDHNDMAGIVGHYLEKLAPVLVQLSQAGAALAQEFVS